MQINATITFHIFHSFLNVKLKKIYILRRDRRQFDTLVQIQRKTDSNLSVLTFHRDTYAKISLQIKLFVKMLRENRRNPVSGAQGLIVLSASSFPVPVAKIVAYIRLCSRVCDGSFIRSRCFTLPKSDARVQPVRSRRNSAGTW